MTSDTHEFYAAPTVTRVGTLLELTQGGSNDDKSDALDPGVGESVASS